MNVNRKIFFFYSLFGLFIYLYSDSGSMFNTKILRTLRQFHQYLLHQEQIIAVEKNKKLMQFNV